MGRQCRLAAVQPRDPGAVDKPEGSRAWGEISQSGEEEPDWRNSPFALSPPREITASPARKRDGQQEGDPDTRGRSAAARSLRLLKTPPYKIHRRFESVCILHPGSSRVCEVLACLLSPRLRHTEAAPEQNSSPPRRTPAGPHGGARGAQAEAGGEGAGGAKEGSGCRFTVCLAVGDPGPGVGGIGVVGVALGVQVVEEDVDFIRRNLLAVSPSRRRFLRGMYPTVGTLGPSLPPGPLLQMPSPALCPQFARCPPPPAHPRSPTARSAANKGEEKPQVDPSLPTKTPFVHVPKEKRVRGVFAHAQLCPEKGYFGRSCCRREERGRSRRFDLFLRRRNFAGEGPSLERGAGLVSRPAPAPAPAPPVAAPRRPRPGRRRSPRLPFPCEPRGLNQAGV
ncbi:uncharacterized protein WM294_007828 [Sarcoramphus papa]